MKKYFLYTASTPMTIGDYKTTGTIPCEGVFFTEAEFNNYLNSGRSTAHSWNIIFLMEITEDQYNYYNKG